MKRRILTAALAALASTSSHAAQAQDACTIDGITIEVGALTAYPEAGFVEFQVTINNASGADIGGLIVEYEMTAPGRPSPLASDISQFTHTLDGGLLSGESTAMRDIISLSDHAANIIATSNAKNALSVSADITAMADAQMQPVGGGIDPFQLWSRTPSPITCQ